MPHQLRSVDSCYVTQSNRLLFNFLKTILMKNLHVKKLTAVVLFFLTLGTITTQAQELKYSWIAVDFATCELWDEINHDLLDISLTASWMQDFSANFAGGLMSGVYSRHGSADIPLGGDFRYNMFTRMNVNPFVGVKAGLLIGTRGDFALDTLVMWSVGLRVKQKLMIGVDFNYWRLREIKKGYEDPYCTLRLGWEF